MVEGQLHAYELYRHDLVSVGVDTYNVECEALGSQVVYFEGQETPGLRAPLLKNRADLQDLHLPDPRRDGRMPLLLEAGMRLRERLGDEVLVNCTVVGPFTLAANLRGFEQLVMDIYEAPDFVHRLLAFTTRVGQVYADSCVSRGLSVSLSESWIAPPLISPRLSRDLVVGYERELISHIQASGQPYVALISGGDTTPLLEDLIATGASLLLADHRSDLHQFKVRTMGMGLALRGNVDPRLVESGPIPPLVEATLRVLKVGKPGGRFILGTGVVPYATPPEHLLAMRQLVESHGAYS